MAERPADYQQYKGTVGELWTTPLTQTPSDPWTNPPTQANNIFSDYTATLQSAPQTNLITESQDISTPVEHSKPVSNNVPELEQKPSSYSERQYISSSIGEEPIKHPNLVSDNTTKLEQEPPSNSETTETLENASESDKGKIPETDLLESHEKFFDSFLQNNAIDVENVIKIVSALKEKHSVLVRNKSTRSCPFLAALENNIIRPETGSQCSPYHLTISSTDIESEFQLKPAEKAEDSVIVVKQEPKSDSHGLFQNSLVSFDSSTFGSGFDNAMGSLVGSQCLEKVDKKPDRKPEKRPRGRPRKNVIPTGNVKTAQKRKVGKVSEDVAAKRLKDRLRKSAAKNRNNVKQPTGRPNLISQKLVGSVPTSNLTKEEKIARRKKVKALYSTSLTGMWVQFPELNSPILR